MWERLAKKRVIAAGLVLVLAAFGFNLPPAAVEAVAGAIAVTIDDSEQRPE